MKPFEYELKTARRTEMLNVTGLVAEAVSKSGVSSGTAVVFVPHTTAGVTINENADPDVCRDLCREIDSLVPWEDSYSHAEGNSAAHLKSSLYGPSLTVIVEGGRPLLGTWQGIYFCEFDGPRRRRLLVKVVAD